MILPSKARDVKCKLHFFMNAFKYMVSQPEHLLFTKKKIKN